MPQRNVGISLEHQLCTVSYSLEVSLTSAFLTVLIR